MKKKLNIGCGFNKLIDYINIDINPHCEPDILRDIQKGLPFNDNTFNKIRCAHVLEHITDLIFVMNEIYRVLKPNGELIVFVPPWDKENAYSDPTHVRRFTKYGFKFWTIERFKWLTPNPDIKCIFEIIHFKLEINPIKYWEYNVVMKAIK